MKTDQNDVCLYYDPPLFGQYDVTDNAYIVEDSHYMDQPIRRRSSLVNRPRPINFPVNISFYISSYEVNHST